MRWSIVVLLVAVSPCGLAAGAAKKLEPTTLKFVKATAEARSAFVTWDAVEAPGIEGWIVEWRAFQAFAGRSFSEKAHLKAGIRAYTIHNLKPGRVYSVTVHPYFIRNGRHRRVARAPLTAPTPTVDVRVGRPGAGRPAPPKNLAAVADGTRVRISWDPSEELNVAGYEISRKAPGAQEATAYLKLTVDRPMPVLTAPDGKTPLRPTGVAEVLDTNVEEGKGYAYSVRAFTGDGAPKYSDPAGPVTVKTEPYALRSADILFVVNTAAKNARKIALNYCRARGITNPKAVKAKLPLGSTITRGDFDRLLLAPIHDRLKQNPRTTILVLVRGVPWRIQETGTGTGPHRYDNWDRASVDSELMLARFGGHPIRGRLPNPLYGRAARLTPLERVLGVCRIDAPDDRTASDLGRRALAAEEKGLEGIAFFDARGLTAGAYVAGDRAILNAADMVKKDGRLRVEVDNEPKVIDLSLTKAKISLYFGWYKGSWRPKNKSFRFGRGAIGVHIHSGAGNAISADRGWVGEMLAHGAAAALGVAHEPLLDGFPQPDRLVAALLQGRNLAEAFLSSCRYLSWMPVCCGDPLYRPFKPKP